MTGTLNASLARVVTEVEQAITQELHTPAVHGGNDRVGEFRSVRRHGGAGFGPDEQVRRGYPGKRYYGGCDL